MGSGDIHDRRSLRVASIIDPEVEPEGEAKCNRHARDMESFNAHAKKDGTIYHIYGDKELYYCPACCWDLCEQEGIDKPDNPAKLSLVIAARDAGPGQEHQADGPLWEECENEEHLKNLEFVG